MPAPDEGRGGLGVGVIVGGVEDVDMGAGQDAGVNEAPLTGDGALRMVMDDLKQLERSKAAFDLAMGEFWSTMKGPA